VEPTELDAPRLAVTINSLRLNIYRNGGKRGGVNFVIFYWFEQCYGQPPLFVRKNSRRLLVG